MDCAHRRNLLQSRRCGAGASHRTARALMPLSLGQELLEAGADPNICDKLGLHPMHYAGAGSSCIPLLNARHLACSRSVCKSDQLDQLVPAAERNFSRILLLLAANGCRP